MKNEYVTKDKYDKMVAKEAKLHEIGKPGDGTMGKSWDDKLDFAINGFTLP